jgi:hypothetical protein
MDASMRTHFSSIRHARGVFIAMLVSLFTVFTGNVVRAQWLEPNRLHIGMSGGFGGLHAWGKPSLDLIYGRLTARAAPGLKYMSGGLTYQFAFFSPKTRHDRILVLSLYYHNDWLLAGRRSTEFRRDQNIWMLLPGIHVNLDHRGTVFLEVSAGPLYQHERIFDSDRSIRSVGDHFAPMGEIRIGGIFLSRVEHVQQFPHYHKDPPVEKIDRVKLQYDE